jgi:hypothetical protein
MHHTSTLQSCLPDLVCTEVRRDVACQLIGRQIEKIQRGQLSEAGGNRAGQLVRRQIEAPADTDASPISPASRACVQCTYESAVRLESASGMLPVNWLPCKFTTMRSGGSAVGMLPTRWLFGARISLQ